LVELHAATGEKVFQKKIRGVRSAILARNVLQACSE
jgi:hypothetical protein